MLAIIGGTGLYQFESLSDVDEITLETPFGKPSSTVRLGSIEGKKVAFLPRHGNNHQFLPSEINYRANIFALKTLGVTDIISVSATGSLQIEIAPGDLAIPSQFLDWTRGQRNSSFFGNGMVAHVSTAQPVCAKLAQLVQKSAIQTEIKLHTGKTYACVEGPRLGTRAESFFLKNSGCDLVGMTNVPEVFLAREAQIGYCTIAVATDYDCWLDDPSQHASVEIVIRRYMEKIGTVKQLLVQIIKNYELTDDRPSRQALKGALMTPLDSLTLENRNTIATLQR